MYKATIRLTMKTTLDNKRKQTNV